VFVAIFLSCTILSYLHQLRSLKERKITVAVIRPVTFVEVVAIWFAAVAYKSVFSKVDFGRLVAFSTTASVYS